MSTSAASTVVNAAQKATSFANQTVETARFEVLKEPLGFIKILQFFLALLAFSIAVNGSSSASITVNCDPPTGVTSPTTASPGYNTYIGAFSYPYDLKGSKLEASQSSQCKAQALDPDTITAESNNIVSSAQFFVFTGVVAFLYSFAFLIIYVFFRHKYNNLVFFSLADFIATVIFTIFWFAGSIAWSKAVTDIQYYTNPENIIGNLKKCSNSSNCSAVGYPGYANIIVSCILGFGNLILWAGDIWFVLKETAWYKTRQSTQQQQSQNNVNNPISTNDIQITASYNPNNKI